MSGSKVGYVLDSNTFIEAKNRYYSFELCPGFWKALIEQHKAGRVFSIDRILSELADQGDQLSDWVEHEVPDTFFKQTQDQAVIGAFRNMVKWVYSEGFNSGAKAEFASVADGWVIAYAKVNGLTVVSHEKYGLGVKSRVPMPNVCRKFDVPFCNTFEMMEDLGVQLILNTKRSRKKRR
jgi:hypothetical protein